MRLAEYLHQKKINVIGIGRSERPNLSKEIEYHQIKEWNSSELQNLLSDVDCIVHCAGLAGPWGAYEIYYEANVVLTKTLLEAAKNSGTKRFINISSPSVYFKLQHQFNLKEEDIPNPIFDAYGKTKYEAEKLVSKAHNKEMWTVSLRPRGVIGAGDNNWMPRIIELHHSNKLFRPGKGEVMTDFTSVSNLIEFIESFLTAPQDVFNDSYNVTNGQPVNLWEFIDEALILLGEKPQVKSLPQAPLMMVAKTISFWAKLLGIKNEPKILPLKIGVASYSHTLDISKAITKAGYRPKQTNSEALEEFARWWKAR